MLVTLVYGFMSIVFLLFCSLYIHSLLFMNGEYGREDRVFSKRRRRDVFIVPAQLSSAQLKGP